MPHAWKKLSSKVVHENPWYSVSEDDVLRPDGSPGKYYVVHAKSGVCIVPFDGQKLHLINLYRYTIGRNAWEFPSGGVESEDFLHEAKKELLEETGIRASHWTELGEYAPAVGYSGEVGKIYLAETLTFGPQQLEPEESDITVQAFAPEEVEAMIERREIVDSWAIGSFYFFKRHREKQNI